MPLWSIRSGAHGGLRRLANGAGSCSELYVSGLGAAGYATPLTRPDATTGYVHGLGHGVGFELHEYPSFRETSGPEGVLESGDLFTLEPGLYDPEAGWGVRLEDLCCLTDGGLVNLTPLPYELDPRAWGEP